MQLVTPDPAVECFSFPSCVSSVDSGGGANEWKSTRVSGDQEASLKIHHSLTLTFMREVCERVTGGRMNHFAPRR